MRRSKIIIAVVAVVAVLAVSATAMAQRSKLQARLQGDGARGKITVASNGEGQGRILVKIRAREGAGGTVTVSACGQEIGTLTLRARGDRGVGGVLRLGTRNGGSVPGCSAGDSVSTSGAVSLAGTLHGRSPGR